MLKQAYANIKDSLRDQVQGTCGIYSFYNAVQILRNLNALNPSVPAPKKSETKAGDKDIGSLREYAKRQLQSGQGEILSDAEMSNLVAAHGYAPLAFGRVSDVSGAAKRNFLEMCMRESYPVLIAYLADGNPVEYAHAVTNTAGAHWSLIIGLEGKNVNVVEPNNPRDLRTWPLDDLLLMNGKADDVKFPRFWAKTVNTDAEYDRQLSPMPKPKPEHTGRGIEPIGNDKSKWLPHKSGLGGGQVKAYDLGGDTGERQNKQNLNHVLIAVIPPHEPKKTT